MCHYESMLYIIYIFNYVTHMLEHQLCAYKMLKNDDTSTRQTY